MARTAVREKEAPIAPEKGFSRWDDIKQGKMSRKRMEQIDRKVEAEWADLKAIREISGKTQVELAESLTCAQGDVSKMEARQDWKLSTLKRYVEALGGELEVWAAIGDKRVRLRAVE